MKKIWIKQVAVCSVLFATQSWAGSGSSSNDLMNLLSKQKSSPGLTQAAASCEVVKDIVNAPQNASKNWLVFNNPSLLAQPFKFSKTLEHIISTANSNTNTTNVELVTSLLDSYTLTSATNPEPISGTNFQVPVDFRPLESQMSPQAIVDEWFPVGLFNRLDTAPADGSHCGQYRIVYANPGSNANDPSLKAGRGRFFMIFESALPNPLPEKGIEGCTAVANFWVSLASPDLTDPQRVTMLENFFYQGLTTVAADGTPITLAPVVSFSHYNGPLGQVRTNQFLDSRWQLREFRTAINTSGKVNFKVDTVKDNALTEFYDQRSTFNFEPSGSVSNVGLFNTLRSDFQSTFIGSLLPQLIAPDATNTGSVSLINSIRMTVPNRFNEFQSHSQDSSDNVMINTGQILTGEITNALTQLGSTITSRQLLARAEATTCGGCHEFSNGASIGTDANGQSISWPNSAGFVHITEDGTLSRALIDVFLPEREEVLTNFVCDNLATTTPVLENGVAKTGLSGSQNEELRFTLEVPEGATDLQFSINGGFGDADLHVKFGTLPSKVGSGIPANDLECVPFSGGNDELCVMPAVHAGTYHVMVRGFRGFSGVNLTGSFTEAPVVDNVLQNGVTKSGLSGSQNEELRFTLEVPEQASDLVFFINGGSGDTDLYVKFDSPPTKVGKSLPANDFECVPFKGGNVERCVMTATHAGTYHVMLLGFGDFVGVNLTGQFTEGSIDNNALINGVTKSGLSGSKDQELRFTLEVPQGATGLKFNIGSGSGDGDLYVKFNTPPTEAGTAVPANDLECIPFTVGNAEQCIMPSAHAGTYHVMVRGFKDFSGLDLTATFIQP